jgi:uncharacterized MAPEG superfamily protein
MSVALWCVLIAALLPYLASSIAKAGGAAYDNRDPRAWLAQQQGFRKRAANAQANAFEAFPFFAVAVLVAQVQHAPQDRVDALAVIFVAARAVYLLCYLADSAAARSVAWLIGWLACIFIFVSATAYPGTG